MPIKIPDELPAVNFLRNENIFVMTSSKAKIQEIRPLKILVLNLMPKKIETENQLLRLLSNSPLQIDIQFLRIDGYQSKNTSAKHLNSFYCNFEDIKKYNFDGLIVTGAPFGKMNFNQISCWKQITNIFIWLKTHVTSTLFICWAAQAALNIIYDIPKKIRKTKLSGVYKHHILHPNALITKGFDDIFLAPHSRYADFSFDFITNHTNLEIFASSKKTGIYLMASKDKRFVFVTGHPEYDAITLANEYYRDYSVGLKPKIPYNYFPKNDKNLQPSASWRSHGNLLFLNWLNYYIYQITPYDLNSF